MLKGIFLIAFCIKVVKCSFQVIELWEADNMHYTHHYDIRGRRGLS